MTNANNKITELIPTNRRKRGLINGIGSIIKTITGNLDNTDAEYYDQTIDKLKRNQNQIITTVNQQISLSDEIIQNFNETVSIIKNNQELLTEKVDEISHNLNKFILNFNHLIYVKNTLDQLSLMLNLITQLLQDIENALAFAKIGVAHPAIIKTKDLFQILTSLKVSPEQLLFPINFENVNKFYNVLEIKAYVKNKTIVFIISLPIVSSQAFDYYKLYSVPIAGNQSHHTIIPPRPYYLSSEQYYMYVQEECLNLEPTSYFCKEDHKISYDDATNCLGRLLQLENKPSNCEYTTIEITEDIIEQISEEYYLIVTPSPREIETNCENRKLLQLHGSYLIHLPTGCSFSTSHVLYQNQKIQSKDQFPVFLLESGINVQNTTNILPVRIKNIPLSQLQELQRHGSSIIDHWEHNQFPIHLRISVWTIMVYVSIGACLTYYIRKAILSKIRGQREQPGQEPADQGQPFYISTRQQP